MCVCVCEFERNELERYVSTKLFKGEGAGPMVRTYENEGTGTYEQKYINN